MSEARAKALAKLEATRGEVAEEEVAYHLGEAAVLDLYEAAEEGLVVTRTTFELTDRGRELLGEKTGAAQAA